MKPSPLEWSLHSLKEGENRLHLSLKPEDLGINSNTVKKTIECDIVLKRNGSKVSLLGVISFSLVLECARCLERFTLNKSKNLSSYFIASETSLMGEKESLSPTDVITEYYENDIINLAPMLYDSVNLAIPIKPLCRDNCKGLCPICGTNLNRNQCSCEREKIDPRWEPLKKFLKKK